MKNFPILIPEILPKNFGGRVPSLLRWVLPLALSLILVSHCSDSGADSKGRIIDVTGEVAILDKSGKSVPGRADLRLKGEETIRTRAASSASLFLDGVGLFKVSANSEITLGEVNPNGKTELKLPKGGIGGKILKLKKSQEVRFRTPTTVAGVRGTQLSVEYNEGRSTVAVLEGQVEVRAVKSKKATLIRAGRTAEVREEIIQRPISEQEEQFIRAVSPAYSPPPVLPAPKAKADPSKKLRERYKNLERDWKKLANKLESRSKSLRRTRNEKEKLAEELAAVRDRASSLKKDLEAVANQKPKAPPAPAPNPNLGKLKNELEYWKQQNQKKDRLLEMQHYKILSQKAQIRETREMENKLTELQKLSGHALSKIKKLEGQLVAKEKENNQLKNAAVSKPAGKLNPGKKISLGEIKSVYGKIEKVRLKNGEILKGAITQKGKLWKMVGPEGTVFLDPATIQETAVLK